MNKTINIIENIKQEIIEENTVNIMCECGKEYFVSVQQRFIARKIK